MTKQTDIELTLTALRQVGKEGIHSFTLNHLVGTTRAAARIQDLKDMGYLITSKHETKGTSRGVRYFLDTEPTDKQLAEAEYKWIFEDNKALYVRVTQLEDQGRLF